MGPLNSKRPDAAPPKNIVEAADRVIDKLQQAAAVQDGAVPPKDRCPPHNFVDVPKDNRFGCLYSRLCDGCGITPEELESAPPSDAAPPEEVPYPTPREDGSCPRCGNLHMATGLHGQKEVKYCTECGWPSAPPPSDAAPVAWLAEDHLFTPVRRSLHFEESTARAHHGTHEADSDEPIPLYAHPEDAAPGTCSQCGGETYVGEITCCRNCSNEVYTRAQSLAASRALGLVHGRPGSPAAHPETAPRPDKASQGSTDSGGERPEQVEDAPEGPWRSENIGDADRSWGPTVWDSCIDAEGYGIPGTSRFHFATLPLAEAIRDVLNRDFLNGLKEEET